MRKPGNLESRRHWWFSCGLVILSLIAIPTQATEKLTPHTAEYKVKISVVSGKLSTEVKATDSGYIAKHEIVATGLSRILVNGSILEESEFSNGADGVYPVAYRSNDSLSRDKTRADIRFDWDANEARGTVNDEEFLSVLDGLSHDHVSIQYELMHDLMNGELSAQYRLFEVDKRKMLNVRSIGTRKVKVPAGTFTAVGIQHQAENSSRVTTLWCVEELDYLPVMIEQHSNDKLRVRATLRNYTPTQDR